MRVVKGFILVLIGLVALAFELYFLVIEPLLFKSDLGLPLNQYWALSIPVLFITGLICFIFIWIGYTIIRTPEPIRLNYDAAYEFAEQKVDES